MRQLKLGRWALTASLFISSCIAQSRKTDTQAAYITRAPVDFMKKVGRKIEK